MPSEGLRTRSKDGLSPELALVDPSLGAHARSSLPQSDDTLARLELLVRAHRITVSRAQADVAPAVVAEPPAASAPRGPAPPPTGPRRAPLLAGGAAAAALVAALLVGVRIDLRGSPAGAESTAIGEPPVALPRADAV